MPPRLSRRKVDSGAAVGGSRRPTPHPSGAVAPAIPVDLVPRHVALVMDGNGRWAADRGLPRTAGHEAGEASLLDCVHGAIELGIGWISAYAFSTENWRRSPDEVRFLMGFNRDVIRRRRDEMHELGVRVRWAGRRPRLWKSVIDELEVAEGLTRANRALTLTMCVNYGGRAEIADAAKAIAREAAAGRLDPDRVDERTSPATSTSPTCRTSTCSYAPPGSSVRAISCCGSRHMPSWCSSPPSGPTSTAVTCGAPASSTRPGTAATAARSRRRAGTRTGVSGRPRSGPRRRCSAAVGPERER